MISMNNAGQQPRLDIDLNVEYRMEDNDALNDDRVGGSGTLHSETHEAGRRICQIRVISDSAQTSFSMRHNVPQAQTSLRAPRDQAVDAGRIVVSIENANQRILVTSSLPSASSSEIRCERPGGQSNRLPFATSSIATSSIAALNNEGQSSEASEGRIPKNGLEKRKRRIGVEKKYPVPEYLRKPGETDETRLSGNTLSKRHLVPVPEALRLEGETDQTRIARGALTTRRLVLIPEPLRRPDEAPDKLIPLNQVSNRQWVRVPPEWRNSGETDETRITRATLQSRKRWVSIPKALRELGETKDTKITRYALLSRKRMAEQSESEEIKRQRTERTE